LEIVYAEAGIARNMRHKSTNVFSCKFLKSASEEENLDSSHGFFLNYGTQMEKIVVCRSVNGKSQFIVAQGKTAF
jgi:hypothetical protein